MSEYIIDGITCRTHVYHGSTGEIEAYVKERHEALLAQRYLEQTGIEELKRTASPIKKGDKIHFTIKDGKVIQNF